MNAGGQLKLGLPAVVAELSRLHRVRAEGVAADLEAARCDVEHESPQVAARAFDANAAIVRGSQTNHGAQFATGGELDSEHRLRTAYRFERCGYTGCPARQSEHCEA